MTEAGGEEFMLEVPASPQYVGTARLFAAAIARRFGCEPDTVDDLKLAVSEACTRAMAPILPSDRIRVAVVRTEDRFAFDVGSVHGRPGPAGRDDVGEAPADDLAPLGLDLIRSLFPDTEVLPGFRVRFSVTTSEAT